ncbi:hypothetical protein [Mesorhizobium sp. M1121]|uniref:hypothetical protein n=1 Tax=Mesorhizobium sp. M1121 TaxID=2957058 RepID=UPI0033367D83
MLEGRRAIVVQPLGRFERGGQRPGSSASRKAATTASSICPPPTLRQWTPLPSTTTLPGQW